jgi:hypothetical protein
MDRFNLENPIERAIDNEVNRLVGDKDVSLGVVIKMGKLKEYEQIQENELKIILDKMLKSNRVEKEIFEQEFYLTYDKDGNLIEVNNIDDKFEEDTKSILQEPKGSEE